MQKISALMDGELDQNEAQALFNDLKQPEMRQAWETYHVIGDAMRGHGCLSPDFSQRFKDRLLQEPTILAPRKHFSQKAQIFAMSAAASLAAVAVVGWVAFSDNPLSPRPAEMATKQPVAESNFAQAPLLPKSPAGSQFDAYLVAHQEFSPSTRMQGLAPYIRTVSATEDAAR